MTAQNVVEIDQLTIGLKSGGDLVRNLTLTIRAGETLCVVGVKLMTLTMQMEILLL